MFTLNDGCWLNFLLYRLKRKTADTQVRGAPVMPKQRLRCVLHDYIIADI